MRQVTSRSIRVAAVGLALAVAAPAASGYERNNHEQLTERAIFASQLGNPTRLAKLGFRQPVGSKVPSQTFKDSKGEGAVILDLMLRGSNFEDDVALNVPGPLTHFFMPPSTPLTFLRADYPTMPDLALAMINSETRTSPDWAVQGDGAGIYGANKYSWKKARDAFFLGATAADKAERDRNNALMFEALGRIMHHMQDMAQPQHVRNDGHLSHQLPDALCPNAPLGFASVPEAICWVYRQLRRESAYEAWTSKYVDFAQMVLPSYNPVYPGDGTPGDGINVFATPRDFWATGGKGMAEFTNRNFFSAGTIDVAPPGLLGYNYELVTDLCRTAVPPCGITTWAPDEVVTFYGTSVDDQFRSPASGVNSRAEADSIFDPEFTAATGRRLTSLNRFTFDAAHLYLAPRAVAYSAGIVNHFFRGDLDISPPAEGAYGVIDTTAAGCGTPCGFRVIKAMLKRPLEVESLFAGHLYAVVRYRRNTCMVGNDLAGDYGGPAFVGANCAYIEEQVAVSDPLTVPSTGVPTLTNGGADYRFTFPTPIPLNATTVSLQIVFRGKMGAEDDAVLVATKDISEPEFFLTGNITDYAFDVGASNRYYALPAGATVSAVPMTNVTFSLKDPSGPTGPLAVLPTMDGGQFAQLAFLTDAGSYHFWAHTTSREAYGQYDDLAVATEPFEYSDDTQPFTFARECPTILVRGAYHQRFYRIYAQIVHGVLSQTAKAQVIALGGQPSGDMGRVAGKATCYTPPAPGTGGLEDLYYYTKTTGPLPMTPAFTPANASRWTINF
jgi:hypothetical protein